MANKPWVVTTTCKHCNFFARDSFRTWIRATEYVQNWSSQNKSALQPRPLRFKIRKVR